ncbi:hypothetical protein HYH03_010807 [Edaphochlamys debaryana]|uniref:Uncharacterized protein n=1 Tax=Edaphochlamys debaryana TaxID=47281 RepID=A0A835XW33_9CHLO|nr:hypothetical protein HYH03_010807 [Edaphochlamys debaryana]|eukprot:KAG2490890.1 hypothetical protein HYH03_010807 [Edaphochlamys debaryana]
MLPRRIRTRGITQLLSLLLVALVGGRVASAASASSSVASADDAEGAPHARHDLRLDSSQAPADTSNSAAWAELGGSLWEPALDDALETGLGAAEAPANGQCNVTNPPYNPHTRPSGKTPWFEGWYVRVTDVSREASFAVGLGHFPDQQSDLPDPPAACFLLASPEPGAPTRLFTRSFAGLKVVSPINSSSTGSSPSDVSFSLLATDSIDPDSHAPTTLASASGSSSDRISTDFCRVEVTQGSIRLHASLAGARVRLHSGRGACSAAEPWGGAGDPRRWQPEGWLSKLGFLLRLEWDVLSLRTPARFMVSLPDDDDNDKFSDPHRSDPHASDPHGSDPHAAQSGDVGPAAAPPRNISLWAGRRLPPVPPLPPPPGPVPPFPPPPPKPVPPFPPTPPGPVPPFPPTPPSPPLPVWRLGEVHLEKNWGASFPDQWVWAQGHKSTTGRKASFVLAGGMLPHVFQPLIPAIEMFVFSYHPPPPAEPFTLDPWDPPLPGTSALTVRGCEGVLTLQLFSPLHIVEFVASAPPDSFTALPCPTESGFKNYSVESFSAAAQLRVLLRPFPLAPRASARLLHEDAFEGAALEFGGAYVCPERMKRAARMMGVAA